MRWEGYRLVPVKKIVLPGDIPLRQRQQHVKELAESIRQLGQEPIQAPTINGETHALIAGRDRMAALLLLKVKSVWCHVAGEVTDEDARDLEIDENLHRRQDDRDELIARRVAKVATKVAKERAQAPVADRGRGRPKSPEGEAREIVARELGTTPDAVRAAQTRATAPAELPNKASDNSKPPVITYGLALPTGFVQEIAASQAAVDRADQALRRAQTEIAMLKSSGKLGAAIHARTQAEVHRAADAIRRQRPDSVCPCCKLVPAILARCTFCGGLGVVSEDKLAGAAPELLLSGDKCVVVDGRGGLIPYAKALAGETAPKAAKPAKKLQVEDADGNPIALPPADISDEDIPF